MISWPSAQGGSIRLAATGAGLTQEPLGPLTLEFDRITWSFLKIDMRHEAYRHGKKYELYDRGHFFDMRHWTVLKSTKMSI